MPDISAQEREVWECAARITAIGKRVLLVHGQGAADREAFVVSRLAPFLEAPGRMFGFVRSADGAIIRAPRDAAGAIAHALQAVADGTGQVGPERRPSLSTDLPERVVPHHGGSAEGPYLVGKIPVGADPFPVLADLTQISPDTIIVAVSDPAVPADAGPDDPLLSFLRAVGETQIDAKVVVTVDHEAYGRLRQALATGSPDSSYVVDHRVR